MTTADQPPTEAFTPDYLISGFYRTITPLLWPVIKGTFWFDQRAFKPENRIGLLTGSILAQSIVFPNEERTNLVFDESPEGEFSAYDFKRSEQFGEVLHAAGHDIHAGKMAALLLNSVLDNPAGRLTPLDQVDFLKMRQALKICWISLSGAVELQLIAKRSYGDAYAIAGALNQWEPRLRQLQLIEEPVYQITPKGNGLIDLIQDFPGRQGTA